MHSILAKLVMTAGVIVAVCAAAKLPAEGARFPSTLPVFVGAMVVAAMGIIAWRISARSFTSGSTHARHAGHDPLVLARQIQQRVHELRVTATDLDGDRLCEQVEQIIDNYVLPFVHTRREVLSRLGPDQGAELVMELAHGERLLNRVWTAAADHHLPAALASLAQADAVFSTLELPAVPPQTERR